MESVKAAKKAYYENNKEQLKQKRKRNLKKERHLQLMSTYKISLVEYERMLNNQNNLCVICKSPELSKSKNGKLMNLAVDHCHNSGKIRGLLCGKCNLGLGKFEDSIETLQNAINYLKSNQ